MKTLILSFFAALCITAYTLAEEPRGSLVLVEGGAFQNKKSNYHGKEERISSFYIGRYEVTQREWAAVMGTSPSQFKGENLPVENVSWYDCIEYCIQRSLKEGLKPYYTVDKNSRDPKNENPDDDLKWLVTVNAGADGYRLPTEREWEYAASGGRKSVSFIYSGSADLGEVAWYWQNSGETVLTGLWNWPAIEQNKNQTKSVGGKLPNELGLHDMSGNVREWCWDWFGDLDVNAHSSEAGRGGAARVWRGGGWMGGEFCCEISFRGSFEPAGKGPDQGVRVCRDLIK